MNEQLFLSWLFEKYNVSDFSIEYETPKYKNGLISNIDFYRLKEHVQYHCKSLPSVADLNRIVKNHHFLITRPPFLAHIDEIKRTPKLDLNTIDDRLKQKVLNFCKKYGAKTRLKENKCC